jgi:hypothetical protein
VIDPKIHCGTLGVDFGCFVAQGREPRYGDVVRSNVAVVVLSLDGTERKRWSMSATGELRTSPELPLLSQ